MPAQEHEFKVIKMNPRRRKWDQHSGGGEEATRSDVEAYKPGGSSSSSAAALHRRVHVVEARQQRKN